MEQEYKPNSNRSKELRPKRVEKVISGTAKVKESGSRKLVDAFISEDASTAKSTIFLDVIVPTLKKLFVDIIETGLDVVLYGGSGRVRRDAKTSKVSYSGYYNKSDSTRQREYRSAASPRGTSEYSDILLETRGEADHVLFQLGELIDMYDVASVGDLYDLAGISSNFTDLKYGWTDIHSAQIIRTRDGYLLKMPKAKLLD